MSDPTPIYLSVDPARFDDHLLGPAVDALAAGELVVYPTDTLYGLGADPAQETAVDRVFDAKGRPDSLPVPLIAADLAQVDRHVGLMTPLGRRLADRFWPGPVTLIVEALPLVSRRLLGGGQTVAVRVPDQPVARAVARLLGRPVTATSANRSGEPPPATASEAVTSIGAWVSVVIDGGPAAVAEPSTIVDVRTDTPVLVRRGVVPWERVVTLGN